MGYCVNSRYFIIKHTLNGRTCSGYSVLNDALNDYLERLDEAKPGEVLQLIREDVLPNGYFKNTILDQNIEREVI